MSDLAATPDSDVDVPAAELQYQSGPDYRQAVVVTADALEAFRRARPWMLTVAIFVTIGVGFMLLGGVGMLVSAAFIGGDAGFFIGAGLAYLLFALPMLLVTLQLYQQFSALGRLAQTRNPTDLELAAQATHKFWRGVAVTAIAFVVLYFAFIAVLIVVGL